MAIENCFMSDCFFETIYKLKQINPKLDEKELTSNLINYSMLYFRLNYDGKNYSLDGYEDFLNTIVNYYELAQKDDVFRNKKWNHSRIGEDKNLHHAAYLTLAKDLLFKNGYTKEDLKNPTTLAEINNLLDEKMWKTEFYYHAFNGGNLDGIIKNGINPAVTKEYQIEINEINHIFEKHGVTMSFGWQKINSENKVSYSKTAAVSYYYGTNSPEWFSQFCGNGFHFMGTPGIDKNAYKNSNYNSAKKNIELICKKLNFSKEETEKTMAFFEKYWKKYANKQPMIAVIPQEELSDSFLEIFEGNPLDEAIAICDSLQGVDAQSTTTIDTKNAKFFYMPTEEQVKEKLKEIDKKHSKKSTINNENCK